MTDNSCLLENWTCEHANFTTVSKVKNININYSRTNTATFIIGFFLYLKLIILILKKN